MLLHHRCVVRGFYAVLAVIGRSRPLGSYMRGPHCNTLQCLRSRRRPRSEWPLVRSCVGHANMWTCSERRRCCTFPKANRRTQASLSRQRLNTIIKCKASQRQLLFIVHVKELGHSFPTCYIVLNPSTTTSPPSRTFPSYHGFATRPTPPFHTLPNFITSISLLSSISMSRTTQLRKCPIPFILL